MFEQIEKPTLLLDEAKVRRNIQRMSDKVKQAGVQLRPHFKTHQSAEIGQWFKEAGVTAVTVSSLDMGAYFIEDGWQDVLVAFPVNLRQIGLINQMAQAADLGLLLLDEQTAVSLDNQLEYPVTVWIEIDAGYGRSGIPWQNQTEINRLAQVIVDSQNMTLCGILTHAGNSYSQPSPEAIIELHSQTVSRLHQVHNGLWKVGIDTAVSIGDTPSCSIATDFAGVDEIRPGNYVFYDLMQWEMGACQEDDIAVGVACPVVAKYAENYRVILYGGGVHLSKDMMLVDGETSYGRIAFLTNDGWGKIEPEANVVGLSQEHGIVQVSPQLFEKIEVGSLLFVLPVHSCMTVDLYRHYTTLDGKQITKMRTN